MTKTQSFAESCQELIEELKEHTFYWGSSRKITSEKGAILEGIRLERHARAKDEVDTLKRVKVFGHEKQNKYNILIGDMFKFIDYRIVDLEKGIAILEGVK